LLVSSAKNRQLQKLYLAKSKIPEKVALHLAGALNDSNLTVLDLKACFIEHKPMKQICNCLLTNKKLQELYLSGNTVKKKTGEILCQSLEQNTTLTTLALRNCFLPKSTLLNLLKFFKRSKTTAIKVLDLALNTEIANSDVIEALEDMLTNNHTIEDLNLSACKLSGKMLQSVLAGVGRNTALKVLHLDANKVGKDIVKIAGVIKQPSTCVLEELTLRKCDISAKQLEEFFEALGSNTGLRRLLLEKNDGLEKVDLQKHSKNYPNLVIKL